MKKLLPFIIGIVVLIAVAAGSFYGGMVSGSENDDGSIMARSVQVAPAGRMAGPAK